MAEDRKVVSRHFLRRTARKAEQREETSNRRLIDQELIEPLWRFRVEKAPRGPFRYYVVAIRR